jgi:acyl-CoA synthetase (AMP-forming)/AMP-acid ligase II
MNRFELFDRIERTAAQTPTRPAYIELRSDRSLDYAALHQRSRALAVHIASQLQPNSVALLRSANQIEFPIWFLALLSAGIHVCPVIPELTARELRQLAHRTGATVVIGSENLDLPTNWPIDFQPPTAIASNPNRNSDTTPGDLLLASSGTTGEPKIVRRNASSLDAVSAAMVDAIRFTESDQVLASVPLSHSYGLEHGLLAPLWAGSTVHLCEGLDLPVVAAALGENISIFPAVPPMIEMLSTLAAAPPKMPRLRATYSAGGPLPESVSEKFRARFGIRVGQVYGMTEIGSVTFSDPRSNDFNPASVGRPMHNVSLRLLDLNGSGSPAPMSEEGELAVRAPSMFAGYLHEQTNLIDAHFPTGDLGRFDSSGNLQLTGRVRLLIDIGGTKVNPIEVESVLASHPEVRLCVVVPVRQSETIHRLRAIIVPRDVAAPPTPDSIRQFARTKLASFKIPRLIDFRPALPLTPAGKVQRHQVETS